MLQEITDCTVSEPLQLAVKPFDVPQAAVTLIPLYVPVAGLLQSGALADQATLVAVFPLLQVKTGGVTAKPENPFTGTGPQVSVAGATVEELGGTEEELLGSVSDDDEDETTVSTEEDDGVISVDEEEGATADEEEDETTTTEEEDKTTATAEEDGTITTEEDDGGVISADEEDGSSPADEEDEV